MVTTIELIGKSFTRTTGMMRDVMTPICVGHGYLFRFDVSLSKSTALSTIKKTFDKYLKILTFVPF